ncbi:hypothetical protein AB0I28_27755 [Phytomonospora sp. NPDC050363]|uniref:hypothetical protein n=1 Tax=Phytomonospora sp. NPDC050363 TaxID=3155642 RepID=UPI0033C7387D
MSKSTKAAVRRPAPFAAAVLSAALAVGALTGAVAAADDGDPRGNSGGGGDPTGIAADDGDPGGVSGSGGDPTG